MRIAECRLDLDGETDHDCSYDRTRKVDSLLLCLDYAPANHPSYLSIEISSCVWKNLNSSTEISSCTHLHETDPTIPAVVGTQVSVRSSTVQVCILNIWLTSRITIKMCLAKYNP